MIDLDALYVELYPAPDRSSQTVKMALEKHIIFRHGSPKEIRSDHAKEFISEAARELAVTYGYEITTTHGYNPRGNSVIESFWRYLGKCLRLLSDEEYQKIGQHLPSIAWSWNISSSRSTSVSPYEIYTGVTPTTATTAPFVSQSGGSKIRVDKIRQAAKSFAKVAKTHGDHERKLRAELLNTRKSKSQEFGLGSEVYIYKPPSAAEASNRSRKVKHISHWKGPLVIANRLSNTTFTIQSQDAKYRYQRHLTNIRSAEEVREEETTSSRASPVATTATPQHKVGDFVLVKESQDSWYSIALIVGEAEEQGMELHIHGSFSNNIRSKIVKVYTKGDRTLYIHEKGCRPFLMWIHRDQHHLLSEHKVSFDSKKGKRLSKETLKYIKENKLIVRLQHHGVVE